MNAEQLHTIASMVIADVEDANILKSFNSLIDQLNQLVANPGDVDAQNNVAKLRSQLFDRLNVLAGC